MIWFCLVPVRISVVYLLFCLNPVPILIRCKLVGTTKPKHKACWKWKNKKNKQNSTIREKCKLIVHFLTYSFKMFLRKDWNYTLYVIWSLPTSSQLICPFYEMKKKFDQNQYVVYFVWISLQSGTLWLSNLHQMKRRCPGSEINTYTV